MTTDESAIDRRLRRITFKLKTRPPLSTASKTLISDGEATSGSGCATNKTAKTGSELITDEMF